MRRGPGEVTGRVVLPPAWREQAMRQCHDQPSGGHMGHEATSQKLRMRFWWPGLASDVQQWVARCGVCSQVRGPNPSIVAPLCPLDVGEPLSRLAIDIVGPLPKTRGGNRFILTMVDAFTKWAEAAPLKEHTAKAVANAVLQHWASRFGTPREIMSDQGSEFESALFKNLCRLLQVQKMRSSPYHPMGNGAVERLNRTLKGLLLAHSTANRLEWDKLCLCACGPIGRAFITRLAFRRQGC
jgi:hypothetical protein